MTTMLTLLIRIYQIIISPLLGSRCCFSPTCSNYATEALQRFGLLKGGWLACKRLLKCQPLSTGGYDAVPQHTSIHNHNHNHN